MIIRFLVLIGFLGCHTLVLAQVENSSKVSISKQKNNDIKTGSSFKVADIIGSWRIDMPQQGDVSLTSYFLIHEDSAKIFDGTLIINNAVDLKFAKQRVEGNEAVFSTDWNRDYRLRAEGDKLHVTVAYSKEPWDSGLAYRVTLDETRQQQQEQRDTHGFPAKSLVMIRDIATLPS